VAPESVFFEGFRFFCFFPGLCPVRIALLLLYEELAEDKSMETWMLADVDNIVRDFMGQLRTATENGWHETKPAHYRAIVAALELALRERHLRRVSRVGTSRAVELAEAIRVEEPLPLGLRWSW
jgi:hypothetical protein